MSIDSTWLRCPNCFSDLGPVGASTYGCANGHRFDRARQGYLTLLPPRAPKTVGDDGPMLAARAAFLESGAYAPIAAGIVDAVRHAHPASPAGRRPPGAELSVADLGCGTGYYSRVLVEALAASSIDSRVLLADRSPDAVRLAHRSAATSAQTDVTGVVLDLWRPLPLRDGVADIALDVFAPRNPAEYARILRPGGALIVAVPTSSHLRELRAAGSLLEIPDGKDQRVVEQFEPHGFRLAARERVEFEFAADAVRREQIAAMGPSAHHRGDADPSGLDSASNPAQTDSEDVDVITAAVDILTLVRG
ncbi:methyltransferase domain-containing protein [Agromyces protaetiae]|uniref:Methyltransferase domain-containing protein n=1 Tax=Agromyces protaetiae TaxID=2509455 RepID=A0A4P6FJA7_9MICO|nr:methyltransferase domain-containing protein [Agromyces protaetiae]QAY74067.1 methyltransferase domain-containing protein [Agromyces protaetiae]